MNSSELFAYANLFIFLMGFIWFMVDTYLLTHYGGKLNRGFKVWSRSLTDDEWKFLSNLDHDIIKTEEHSKWVKRKSVSFIAVSNGKALIRYTNPSQNTSWPIVSYVDLTFPGPELEYRMSIPGLLFWLTLLIVPISWMFDNINIGFSLFMLIFFIVMFGVSMFSEIRGNKVFLARQIEMNTTKSSLQGNL